MSDRELVTIDSQQFQTLELRLNSVRAEMQIIHERLGPVAKDKSIQQTLEDGFAVLVNAIRSSSGGGDVGNKLDQLFVLLRTIAAQQKLTLELLEGSTQSDIDNIAARIKAVRERLKTSVDSQTKETET
jgi:hypothetical protein